MSKVVMLRGTSGSGKTYAARRLLEMLGPCDSTFVLGPRGGIGGYQWDNRNVAVLGRYQTACGGCDSMSWKGAPDDIEAELKYHINAGRSVFLEGLMISAWGTERLLRVKEASGGNLHILHITTPLAACLESINQRRAARAEARGKVAEPLNTKNTTLKYKQLLTHTRNQKLKGIPIEEHSRETVSARVLELFGLSDTAAVA